MSPRVLLAVAALLAGCSSKSGGSESAGPSGQPPAIVSFTATPASIAPGESSVLAWNVTGATSLSIDQGVGPVSGASVTVKPAATTTYMLTAANASGSANASSTVTVTGAPAPSPSQSFRLSGSLTVASGTEVDSDVNDALNPNVANDTADKAQRIGNPTTVGGYVNLPGAGEKGRTFEAGDAQDVYLVDLTEGQKVMLSLADVGTQASPNDLDLGLFDQKLALVDMSLGTHETEVVTAPASGTYYVVVKAYAGATNYVLSIAMAGAGTAPGLRLSEDFVPGEIIVQLVDETPLRALPPGSTAAALGLTPKAGAPSRPMLLSVPAGAGRASAPALRASAGVARDALAAYDALSPDQQRKWDTLMAIKELRRRPDVRSAEPNHVLHLDATPNDERLSQQWHYPLINLPQAWDLTHGNASVIVAVIDSGVLHGHPDLQGKIGKGYDFVANASKSRDGDGIDPDPEDPGGMDNNGTSSSFHGTHVIGTIAAATNNGLAVAGAGWDTMVMPLRVCVANCREYDTVQALRYAAALPNDSGTLPDRKPDVINMSIGGFDPTQALRDAVTAARDAGIILVAAAGNAGTAAPEYPAAFPGVVSVSAVDMEKKLTTYSSFGAEVDVAAPGGDTSKDLNGDSYKDGVLSTCANDSSGSIVFNYRFYEGTSMASPHVAAVAALMKAVDPGLTPDKFDAWLAAGELTQDLGDPGRDDKFGYGLIDASKAVMRAQQDAHGGPPPANPALAVSPESLNFGTGLASAANAAADLSATNAGGGALSIEPPAASAPWLSVAPKQVDAATRLGTWTVTASRTGLTPGNYTGAVRFTPSVGAAVDVKVAMQVAAPGQEVQANAGFQHVLVVDPNTWATVAQADVLVSGAKYAFSFEAVPAGTWLLYSGSDFDNDGYICDSGESCGAYLTLDNPVKITLDHDLTGMDFPVTYPMWIGAATLSPAMAPAHPPRPLRLLHASR